MATDISEHQTLTASVITSSGGELRSNSRHGVCGGHYMRYRRASLMDNVIVVHGHAAKAQKPKLWTFVNVQVAEQPEEFS